MMHPNSLSAESIPDTAQQKREIVAFVAACDKPPSRQRIAFETGLPLASVCGRVTALIKAGVLDEVPGVFDTVTWANGKSSRRACLMINQPEGAQ